MTCRRAAAIAGIAALCACGSSATTGTTSPSPRPTSPTQAGTAGCAYGPGSLGAFHPNPPRTNGGSDHARVVPEMPHDHVTPPARVDLAELQRFYDNHLDTGPEGSSTP